MKKISLLIIVASAFSLMLSSCSRLENLSVTKRHYRSGFYVDLGSDKQTASTPKVSKTITSPTANSVLTKVENKNVNSPEQSSVPVASAINPEKKKQIHKNTTGNVYASTPAVSTMKEDMQVASHKNITSVQNARPVSPESSSSSAPFWVILLFAILIPPLGVYLRFGIIDKFWISLLLTLIFWLPGAIYSVIVVTE